MEYFLIFASLAFTLCGQLLQKLAADEAALNQTSSPFLWRLLQQKNFWWAAICLAVGAVIWLFVLLVMDVSKAFPLLSLSFVIVLLVSRLYLNEVIRSQRWLGVALITLGVIMVSLS